MKERFRKFFKGRFFEILPAALTWAILLASLICSIFWPIGAMYFIIIFSFFWVTRITYLVIHEVISWQRYRRVVKVNWFEEVKKIKTKDWQDYLHVIFLPTYKEPLQVITATLDSIKDSVYDLQKIVIVLAGEERDQENFSKVSHEVEEKYQGVFKKLLITTHPKDLPDEVPGKGSNINFAGHRLKEYIDELGLDYAKVIVSTFDIDTHPHPQYFARLTYVYLNHPKPTQASYQPLALYHNNIWESDSLTRVVANSTTVWNMTELARNDRLFTFSSHSMSFQALVNVGFWQKDIVTEDSRITLQCLFYYDGDYTVEPLYIPVSMNTVNVGSLKQAIIDQYKQMRRWAWGVEHVPYMVKEFPKHPLMPFKVKAKYFFNQFEGILSWATAPILLTVMSRVPLWFADRSVHATAFAQNSPLILEKIMTFGSLGLILNAVLMTIILPKKPINKHWLVYPLMVLEWVLIPFTMIIFGSIPATDAQTRLMLGGKYRLGFWVSKKK